MFIWVRATFPRFRYDQLMRLGWKVFLPLSLLWLVLTAGVLVFAGWLPQRLDVRHREVLWHSWIAPRARSC